jgi:transcriptional regulator with XRE-family HTH domain
MGGTSTWDSMANWTEAEREWWWMGPFGGQIPGLVRRVRRILDVSQRGLAAILEVSQSVVARWETGRTSPRVRVLQQMLELAGLTVTVRAEETGEVVTPMRADGARTHAGSRFPAHADLRTRGWWVPRRWRAMTSIEAFRWEERSRRARDPAIGYRTSAHRKWLERRLHGTPDDHPAVHQLAAEAEYVDELREDRRQEQRTRRTRSSADEPPTQRG